MEGWDEEETMQSFHNDSQASKTLDTRKQPFQ
jgi:hypothetical protein